MSIKLKDLQHREYDGRTVCRAFQYNLDLGSKQDGNGGTLPVNFSREKGTDSYTNVWVLSTKVDRTDVADSQCYYIRYEMPRDGLPLELICATGLRYLQMYIQNTVQLYNNIDFTIGHVTEGM